MGSAPASKKKLLESSREYFTETIAKKDEILRAQIHRTTTLEEQQKSHVAMIEVRDEKLKENKAQVERLERELKFARDKQMSDAEKIAALSDQLSRRGGMTADGEIIGINALCSWRYRPGSDIFLVYNQAWDTEGDGQLNRSLQFKLTNFWKR